MNTRRNFILQALAVSAITSYKYTYANNLISTTPHRLEDGCLYVPIYGPNRLPLEHQNFSILAKINPITEKIDYLPSTVRNLHGLVEGRGNNPNRYKLGIGHESAEKMELYDKDFKHIEVKEFPGLAFRGHGYTHEDNVIVTAESLRKYKEEGILLVLEPNGKEIERFKTGGTRPHEIVDCGKYYAIAHYGDEPIIRNPGDEPTLVQIDNCELSPFVKINNPGVSFIRKSDLQVHAFYPLPGGGRTTHLAVTEEGDVLAMGMNAYNSQYQEAIEECAYTNKVNLLNVELKGKFYEVYIPIYRVSPDKGIVETINAPASIMRRGQSFSFDPLTHLIVGTFAASQTIFVRSKGNEDKFLNTLKFGIADPRGCALIPGTGFVAISGNTDNIAIIDVREEKLIKIIGVPLGQHSHLYWWI